MFLVNSRYPPFFCLLTHFLSRSYKVILPSSFNIISSSVVICSTRVLVLVLVRYTPVKYFQSTSQHQTKKVKSDVKEVGKKYKAHL